MARTKGFNNMVYLLTEDEEALIHLYKELEKNAPRKEMDTLDALRVSAKEYMQKFMSLSVLYVIPDSMQEQAKKDLGI